LGSRDAWLYVWLYVWFSFANVHGLGLRVARLFSNLFFIYLVVADYGFGMPNLEMGSFIGQ
jgi:hypothetical protein